MEPAEKDPAAPGARLLTALLIGGAAAALLYWGMLYLSILAFQINDPVTW